MGECGCGERFPQRAYTIGDLVLGIWEYHGCRYCNTPLGVVVQLYSPQQAADWHVKPIGPFAPDEFTCGERVVPWIGVDELVKAAAEIEDEGGGMDEYGSLADWLHDHGLTLLQRALTKRKWTGLPEPEGKDDYLEDRTDG